MPSAWILQAAAKPIDRPSDHDVELPLGRVPTQRIKARALGPPLGAAAVQRCRRKAGLICSRRSCHRIRHGIEISCLTVLLPLILFSYSSQRISFISDMFFE